MNTMNILKVTPIPAFNDNYIWLLSSKDSAYCVVVDPGDAEPVLNYLAQTKQQLAAILLTHHHNDHIGGVPKLLTQFSVPVFGPARENILTVTHPVDATQSVELPALNYRFQVFDIPGHTKGHIAYYGHDLLFCGDTLFTAGCGRLFEGTPEQMYQSLTQLANLSDNTLVFCGHEYTTANLQFAKVVEPENLVIRQRILTVQQQREQRLPTVPASLLIEKQTNPFLRCHLPTVHAAAEKYANMQLATPVDVFRIIREWKNNFKI